METPITTTTMCDNHARKNRRLDATNETDPNVRRREKRPSWQLSRRNEKEQLHTNASIGRSESSNNSSSNNNNNNSNEVNSNRNDENPPTPVPTPDVE